MVTMGENMRIVYELLDHIAGIRPIPRRYGEKAGEDV